MKKFFILTAAALMAGMSVNAQETSFKSGENSLEIGFNPFSNNFKTFRIDELKYRRFFGDNALRVRAGFGLNSSSNETTDNTRSATSTYTSSSSSTSHPDIVDDPYTIVNKTTNKDWSVNFVVGYERHFDLGKRVSAYVGAEIGYEGARDKSTTEYSREGYSNTQVYNYSKNAYYLAKASTASQKSKKEQKNSGGYNAVVAGIFAGVDIHVYKGLYLGAELGLSINHKSYVNPITTSYTSEATATGITYNSNGVIQSSERQTTNIEQNETQTVTTTRYENLKDGSWDNTVSTSYHDEDVKKRENSFKLDVMPAIRLGWRF